MDRAKKKKDAELAASLQEEYATLKSKLIVTKTINGDSRWITITTTAYRDKDGEIITTNAIKNYVQLATQTGFKGTLRFFHIPNCDIGDCDTQIELLDGKYLLESGTFRNEMYVQFARRAANLNYQVSPGFFKSMNESGEIHFVYLFERSILPAEHTSNLFTALVGA